MAVVTKAFTPADIFQGPADLFLDIAAPASATPPVQYTNTLQLDASGQPPDASTAGELAAVSAGSTPGTGYVLGDILEITQAGAANGLVRVTGITGPSGVGTVAIVRAGTGYSAASNLPSVHRSGAGDDTTTITITTIQKGINLGLTEGPCSISINPKFAEIMADQYAGAVDAAFVSMACEVDMVIKETNLRKVQKYFAGLLSGAYFDLPAGSTHPAADFLQIGSSRTSQANTHTLLLIAPRRDAASKWVYAMFYRAYLKSAVQMDTGRAKETMLKLKWGCIADTSRVAKDQVGQIIRMS